MAPPACRTWATVDLAAVRHNVGLVRALVEPAGVAAVVKANAYGHGAPEVARAAVEAGAAVLAVASAEEGIELREAGLDAPILIIGASLPSDAKAILAYDLAACLSPPAMLDALRAEARRRRRRARVHLMVDLGMSRDGIAPEEAVALARRLATTPELELEGVATHFPDADEEDRELTERVIAEFAGLCAEIESVGPRPSYYHVANSAGLLRFPRARFNLVRAGIMLYGMAGAPSLEGLAPWQPVLSWRTQVVGLRGVPAGTPVGYNHTYVTARPTVLATLPVGYYDGYVRAYSNNAEVLIRGRRAPVVGRVSMDYITVDVGGIAGVEVGDMATLLGRDGEECIPAEELARRRGTIPYEVTCAIGPRVRRMHVDAEGSA
jgi:alanine racemase